MPEIPIPPATIESATECFNSVYCQILVSNNIRQVFEETKYNYNTRVQVIFFFDNAFQQPTCSSLR